jgi:hypothetical protein
MKELNYNIRNFKKVYKERDEFENGWKRNQRGLGVLKSEGGQGVPGVDLEIP